VVSGQGARVDLEIGEPVVAGPTAHLFGSVEIDGRVAAGCTVRLWTQRGRRVATVDAAGRFDCGQVAVGGVELGLLDSSEASVFSDRGLYNRQLELKEGEEKELVIAFATTSISGKVVRPDGSPAAGLFVQVRSRGLDQKPEDGNEGWSGASTDQDGSFKLAR